MAEHLGVYVDGFNLYYGAKGLCGRGAGWKWLDIKGLARRLLAKRNEPEWRQAEIMRVVYCTAMVSGRDDPTSPQDQVKYLNALRRSKSVDHVEMGNYVETVVRRPLATVGSNGKPQLVDPRQFVDVSNREEKASDVNVATHLLMDMTGGAITRAMVISNDSDLRLPVRIVRERIPVATINPSGSQTAGKLRGKPSDGAGGHWWYQLTAKDIRACQFPSPQSGVHRPSGW